MENVLTKQQVALEQLDWAIHFFMKSAFIPSITLSGAAEEILGKDLDGLAAHKQLCKK